MQKRKKKTVSLKQNLLSLLHEVGVMYNIWNTKFAHKPKIPWKYSIEVNGSTDMEKIKGKAECAGLTLSLPFHSFDKIFFDIIAPRKYRINAKWNSWEGKAISFLEDYKTYAFIERNTFISNARLRFDSK